MNRIADLVKKHRLKLWIAQFVVLISVGVGLGMWISSHGTGDGASSESAHASHQGHEGKAETSATIWTCSMHPQIRRDAPGKCPICGMDLVPVKKATGGMRTISISDDIGKLMRIETTPAMRRYVTANIRMVGKVEYDETRLAHITAWVSGRLDRLYVDYTGVQVNKGDHMVYIYSEELYTAQEELISALRSKAEPTTSRFIDPVDLVDAARDKLRLLGITEEQIREIEQRGTPDEHITIFSPAGGIVVEKLKQEGDRVRTGDRIYTVADLTHLWVQLDAYESDLSWIKYGQEVEFTTEAYPGEIFRGRVAFIDPVLNESTRTVKVRVNVANEDGRLKPEMFVHASVKSRVAAGGRVLDASLAGKWISPMHPEIVKDEPGNCDICGMPLVRAESLGYVVAEPSEESKPLVIPVSAALITGKRAIIYVQIPDADEPTYEGREIVLGPRAGDYYLVRSGLSEGELVVTNGNFKLDSALQISAKPSMMTPEGGGGGGHDHGGDGTKSEGEDEHSGMQMAGALVLPSDVQARLHNLFAAFESVGEAIEHADLARIRTEFAKLGTTLESVDASALSGDAVSLWREFSMLLKNDVVVGQSVNTLQDADNVYLLTKRHLDRIRMQFGLAHAEHEMQLTLSVPLDFQQKIAQLLPAYLYMSEALASDDWNRGAQAIPNLQATVSGISAESLEGPARDLWVKEQTSFGTIIDRFASATDIDSARSAFALLSEEMLAVQQTFGLSQPNDLYVLHCPMAFDGRGASWIQSDNAPRNPYFGQSMLKCADRIEPLNHGN